MASAQMVALEGSPIDRQVYLGFLVLGLAFLGSRWAQVLAILRAQWPVVVFLTYSLMSFAWSQYPDVAFRRWVKMLGDFVMILLVVSDTNPLLALRRLLARYAMILIPLSVLLIKYYPEYGRHYGLWKGETYYSGVTTAKNSLGALCLIVGIATIWRLKSAYLEERGTERKRHLWANYTILALVLWLFWKAHSMTSLICFLLGGALFQLLESSLAKRRPKLVPGVILAVLISSAVILFLGIGSGILSMIGKDPTLTDRTKIWSTIIPMTPSPLAGAGFESFWLGPRLDKIWSVWSWQPNQAHNGFIEIYVNLGWIGVCLLAVVLFAGYRTVLHRWRQGLPASSLMVTYFVVGLVYNFTEAAFFRMMTPVWIVLLLTMTPAPLPVPSELRTLEARRLRMVHSQTQSDAEEGWLA